MERWKFMVKRTLFDHQFFRFFFKIVLNHRSLSKFQILKTLLFAYLIFNMVKKTEFKNIELIVRKLQKYEFTFSPFKKKYIQYFLIIFFFYHVQN